MAAQLKETISAIMGELKAIASTKSIVGDPITLGDKMLVPVSKIMVGFGVGGGEGEDTKKLGGFAGGGAGGARVEPMGFIVIDDNKISFLPSKSGKFDGLIEAVPGIVEKFRAGKSEKKAKGNSAKMEKE